MKVEKRESVVTVELSLKEVKLLNNILYVAEDIQFQIDCDLDAVHQLHKDEIDLIRNLRKKLTK